jgi:transglutaminase-like putative cysteine protease
MKGKLARSWDFPSAGLITLILLTVSQRLYATDWAPGLSSALLLMVCGVLLGLALGASHFKGGGVFWLAIGYSLGVIPLVEGGTFYQQTTWLERMTSLGGRLGNSLYLFVTSQPVQDTVLFVVFAGLGMWIISLLGGYALMRRGDFGMAIAPAGIVLIIIQLYDSGVGDRVIVLAIFAFLCLILLGRQSYVRKRQFWKEQRVSYSAESWTDLNLTLPAAALVLILLAWFTPANGRPWVAAKVAWERLTHPLETVRADLGNAVAGVQGYAQATAEEFYGDTLALGTSASSGDNVTLRVTTPLLGGADRYYWRVRTYDQYVDNQWQTGDALSEPFLPDQPALPLADFRGLASEFVFTTPRANLAVLVTPAHPIWVSRPAVLSFMPASDNFIDPLLFRADPPILVGEQYRVHANIYNPTVLDLVKAGAIYPSWVSENYLQLPRDLSPQIRELARQITVDAENPFEKATAITNYLRASITYSLSVVPPPAGYDPLVWFLFYTRKGFCNYYATAEVILLRSAGVPARMVVGFAQGEYAPPDNFTVLEKDAHAWPEVYFPGIGWVEFEPTASQPVLTRLPGVTTTAELPSNNPAENESSDSAARPTTPAEDSGTGSGRGVRTNPALVLVISFGLLVLLMAGIFIAYTTGLLDRLYHRTRKMVQTPLPILLVDSYANLPIPVPGWLKRWAYFAGLKPIERCFGVVFQSLRWLGASSSPAQTPAEAAAVLSERLPEVGGEIRSLLLEYQHALFSQRHTDLLTARQAVTVIRRKAMETALRQRVRALRRALFGTGSGKRPA